ncbi:hypothetical protein GGQ77_000364 [Geobacillus thermodenitrificans]|nr:hypothetical protein [Geobacillus thermodenitrificans]
MKLVPFSLQSEARFIAVKNGRNQQHHMKKGTNAGKTSVSLSVDLHQRPFTDPMTKDIFDQLCCPAARKELILRQIDKQRFDS